MSFEYPTHTRASYAGIPLARGVKFFLSAQLTLFVFVLLFNQAALVTRFLALVPLQVVQHGMLWQPLTYLFVHLDWMTLLVNFLALYFFGNAVEREMGTRNFCLLYLFSGVGAACGYLAWSPFAGAPMWGASGATFGLLVAYGILFPNHRVNVLLFFVLPVQVRARNLALFFGFTEFLFLFHSVGSLPPFSQMAHLLGGLFGYLYLRFEIPILDFVTRCEGWIFKREGDEAPRSPAEWEEYVRRYVDPILDKISRRGIHSLTRKERKILEKAKQRYPDDKVSSWK